MHVLFLEYMCYIKDTKNSMTWWCRTAPMSPTIAISSRNTPHAMMPPKTGTLAMIATAFPYAATKISVTATACNRTSIEQCIKQHNYRTVSNYGPCHAFITCSVFNVINYHCWWYILFFLCKIYSTFYRSWPICPRCNNRNHLLFSARR